MQACRNVFRDIGPVICPIRGFTIVEVLVAVLVLALGLIGGTAMQLAALRTRHQSALLSGAVQLASAMAERMRANAGQMQLDDDRNPYLNQAYDAASDAAPAPPAQLCYGAGACTEAELARFDLFEWKQQIKAGLPGGRFVICRDANRWNAGARGLNWSCDGNAAAPVVIKLGWRGKNPDGTPIAEADQPYRPAVALTLTGAAQ